MEDSFIEDFTKQLENKLDKDSYGSISDNLGDLIVKNTESQKIIADKESYIKDLERKNELLRESNGSLLKRIGQQNVEVHHNVPAQSRMTKSEPSEEFDFESLFNPDGSFKK